MTAPSSANLRRMNFPIGLLINFGAATLKEGLHRIVNHLPTSAGTSGGAATYAVEPERVGRFQGDAIEIPGEDGSVGNRGPRVGRRQ